MQSKLTKYLRISFRIDTVYVGQKNAGLMNELNEDKERLVESETTVESGDERSREAAHADSGGGEGSPSQKRPGDEQAWRAWVPQGGRDPRERGRR